MRAWKSTFGLGVMILQAALILPYGASAQTAPLELGTVLQQAGNTSPAVTQAIRDWQTAVHNHKDALANLGWQFAVTTDGKWRVGYDPTSSVTVSLPTEFELSRSPVPRQTISLSALSTVDSTVTGSFTPKLDSVALGYALTYPFNKPSTEYSNLQQLARTVEQKSASLALTRAETLISAARSFYDIGKAQLDADIAEKQVKAQILDLDKQKALAQVGRLSEQDVAIAKQRLDAAKLDLTAKQHQVDLARRDLARLIGNPADALTELQWVEPEWQVPDPGELANWLANVANSPTVRQAELAVAAARDALAAAQVTASYTIEPLVSFDANTRKLSAGVDISKAKKSDSDFNTAASFRVTDNDLLITTSFTSVFGGADTAATNKLKVENAAANLATAVREQQQALEETQEKVTSLWTNLQSRAAQVNLQEALLARAQLNQQIVQKQLYLGAATESDLANAELALVQAEADAKKAHYDYQYAYLELVAATSNMDAVIQLGGQH